jgi:hypothetical protein
MASERQIAANRRNARGSTGPRSASGKKRASHNAFRHGLTKPISSAEFDREVETLARQIAGDTADQLTIEHARDAAAAELELARVRRVKVALIERVAAFGRFDVPKRFASPKDEGAWILLRYFGATLGKTRPKCAVDPVPAMPSQEPQRTAEAVRRALPALLRLARYESRAVTRRDRAIRAIALRGKTT